VCGGHFDRTFDDGAFPNSNYPATVSTFRLDKYEVSVGRFRQFVAAVVAGWRPADGSGKHAYLNGGSGLNATSAGYERGWDATDWNGKLATTLTDWNAGLSCDPNFATWTASPAGGENRPVNCETWYEAYAFCIWDGGFLPSEAEWNYAAAGGGGSDGQRAYPWSSPSTSTAIDCAHANYASCPGTAPNSVGSESPAGDGLYGQADLAGNVNEWNLDWYADYVNPCTDCANLAVDRALPCPVATSTSCRVTRSGCFYNDAMGLLVSGRYFGTVARNSTTSSIGARCARAP
jgi:formylglycine-generating enzyme required for sulfatase activity